MPRHIEMKPFIARRAPFDAAEIRHGDEKYSARPKQAIYFVDDVLWTFEMFEHVPHDSGIERIGGQIHVDQFADVHGQIELLSRECRGRLAHFRAGDIPAASLKRAQQMAASAADVEHAARFAGETLDSPCARDV